MRQCSSTRKCETAVRVPYADDASQIHKNTFPRLYIIKIVVSGISRLFMEIKMNGELKMLEQNKQKNFDQFIYRVYTNKQNVIRKFENIIKL